MWHRVASDRFDNVFSWRIGIFFLVVCSVLVALMASEVTMLVELVLIASLAVGWFVLGLLCPGRQDRTAP